MTFPLVSDSLTYFYLDYEFEGNQAELDHLMEFISIGNEAFVCVDNIYAFREVLGLEYQYTVREYYDSSEVVKMNFVAENLSSDSGFNFQFLHADTATIGPWNYFDMVTYSDSMMVYDHADPIGKIEDAINFSSFPVGKGKLYIHLQQRLFSNVHLKEEFGLDYTNRVLSHFADKPIYIDTYNTIYHSEDGLSNDGPSESPLAFLFEHQSLRYAWYTLLLTVVLFLLFRSKRQQRIIPILPKLSNTSIEFARALGTLYYQSNSPKFLCNEMMKLFHNYNRRRYNIQPGKKGEYNTESLAKKSKVPSADIHKIYDLERRLKYNEMARMNEVVPLFKALKNYYKNAK